jgi:hypothetical protein
VDAKLPCLPSRITKAYVESNSALLMRVDLGMLKCHQTCKALGIGIYGITPEQRLVNARKGGMLGGKKAAGRGARRCKTLGIGIFAPGVKSAAGLIGGSTPEHNHVRWHVNRGKVSSVCELCQLRLKAEVAEEEFEVDDFAEQFDDQIRHRDIEVERCRCQGCIKIRCSENNRQPQRT